MSWGHWEDTKGSHVRVPGGKESTVQKKYLGKKMSKTLVKLVQDLKLQIQKAQQTWNQHEEIQAQVHHSLN